MGCLTDRQIERDIKITPFSPQQKRPGVISFGLSSMGYDIRLGYKFKAFTPAFCTGAVIDPKSFDPKAFVEIDLSTENRRHSWRGAAEGLVSCERCGNKGGEAYTPYCPGPFPDHIVIPPHSFVLGESIEEFEIPEDIIVICLGKSTYARCALVVNVTPGEPGWKGKWTIELSNTAPMPVKVYAGEGIAQCLFLRSDGYTEAILHALRDTAKVRGNMDGIHTTIGFLDKHLEDKANCRDSYATKNGKYQQQTGLTLPKVD